jgi:release factor glutamine methyltransferase
MFISKMIKGGADVTYKQLWGMLQQAGIENARDEARLLLMHFCGVTPAQLPFRMQEDFTCRALADAVARRQARVPLQYLLGEWEFFGLPFFVSPDCLIPRPDTEILVEEAIKLLPKGAYFADLCTGSGCIAVSVLAEREDTRALAVDKFPNTLAMAKRNAERQGVEDRMEALLADVLSPVMVSGVPLDAILSNPPYIPTADLAGLSREVREEPRAALDGGEDGLLFYRKILQMQADCLSPEGFILFEVGYDQAEAVVALGKRAGFYHSRIIKDYGGNQRVVYLSREHNE